MAKAPPIRLRVQGTRISIVERKTRYPHVCKLPGWRARRRMDLGYGSVVECVDCDRRWVWGSDPTGSYWMPHYEKEG